MIEQEPARLVKAVFELSLLSLFAVCLLHSLWTHGWRRTGREFTAGFMLTVLAESTGVLSGAYVYPGFRFYVLATPFVNPASWVALVYVIMEVSNRLVFGRRALEIEPWTHGRPKVLRIGGSLFLTLVVLAMVDATLALLIDLVLDPLATIYNWWIWVPCAAGVKSIGAGVVDPYNFDRLVWMTTPDNPVADFFGRFFREGWRYPTRVLGIPLINFVAWVVFVFTYAFQFRWVESHESWSQWRRTLVLWAVMIVDTPILALLLITPNL
ncbi:MAG: carotenoid biosynthesis protein [Myxococcota bacterium]|nr:carotenoid biosynthesis protein [Myxococcota bacterium]